MEVIGEFRPDPTDETGKFGLVDVKAVADLPKPVTLAEAKADPKLAEMMLVVFSRLPCSRCAMPNETHLQDGRREVTRPAPTSSWE